MNPQRGTSWRTLPCVDSLRPQTDTPPRNKSAIAAAWADFFATDLAFPMRVAQNEHSRRGSAVSV